MHYINVNLESSFFNVTVVSRKGVDPDMTYYNNVLGNNLVLFLAPGAVIAKMSFVCPMRPNQLLRYLQQRRSREEILRPVTPLWKEEQGYCN